MMPTRKRKKVSHENVEDFLEFWILKASSLINSECGQMTGKGEMSSILLTVHLQLAK